MEKYKNKRGKDKSNVKTVFITSILTILVIAFFVLIYCVFVTIKEDYKYNNEKNVYGVEKTSLTFTKEEETKDDSEIIEKVNQSIVGISQIKNKGTTIFLEDGTESLGLGTGFIVSENGYILTNEHVSGKQDSICYVTLENGKSYNGKVVWSDSDIDISIIKIEINKFAYLNLGDSNNIRIAEKVYAIGNPIGYEFQRSVTSGIISGLNRTIKIEENNKSYYMEDLIQTDATINPGNSGGPLINKSGEVIGINSIKITSAEGIGFAIPINIVKPVLECLKNNKQYVPATLGIFAYDKKIIPFINQEKGLNESLDEGIYVAQVIKNSPADKSGLKEGDIILKIDNIKLEKMSELREYIYSKKPGDEVKLSYKRNKKINEINIKLVKK